MFVADTILVHHGEFAFRSQEHRIGKARKLARNSWPKTIARYVRLNLLCIDDVLDRRGAEPLFQPRGRAGDQPAV